MEFTPRLAQILFLLLKSKKAIKAADLAEQLHISKRTIFRELEHINKQLVKYDVVLENKNRQGFLIMGSDTNKEALLKVLEKTDSFDPHNREERQKKLILALMQEEQIQKMYYYADLLQVSEATISNDLDTVAQWFTQNQIQLERRAGFGIFLSYEEDKYRNALLSYLTTYKDADKLIINQDIKEAVTSMLQLIDTNLAVQLTKTSYDSLVCYLSIMVERIINRKIIYLEQQEKKIELEEKEKDFIDKVAYEIEKIFQINLSIDEKISLYIFLKSRKMKYIQKGIDFIKEKDITIDLRNLIYEMINAYDATIAYELKQDENLIEGLISHLRPTITRIIHKMPITNPLLEDIKANYPEVYQKSKGATKVIEQVVGETIPDEEIGYLTLHFGGAQTRIEQEHRRKRKVDIGVACASGIGISSLLSSRLIHFFEDEIRITILTTDKLKKGDYENVDLIVSTIELHEFEIPFVHVEPMITPSQLQKIADLVKKFSKTEKVMAKETKNHLEMMEVMKITNEIYSILADFHVYYVSSNIKYEEVLDYCSEILGETLAARQQIYQDIAAREALSTQVIPEYELALFHAKTTAVDNSKFIVILPETDKFEDAYFQGIEMILVMLINVNDSRDTLAISSITNALFTDEKFCGQLKRGKEEEILGSIEQYLNTYLSNCIEDLYKKDRG